MSVCAMWWICECANRLTMTNNDTAKLILRPVSMQHHVESYQDPRQPRSLECEETQKAQPGVGVSTTPDVNQSRAESRAEK